MPDHEGTPTWEELKRDAEDGRAEALRCFIEAKEATAAHDTLADAVRTYLFALQSPAEYKAGSVATCEEHRAELARLVGTVYPA